MNDKYCVPTFCLIAVLIVGWLTVIQPAKGMELSLQGLSNRDLFSCIYLLKSDVNDVNVPVKAYEFADAVMAARKK